MTEVMKPVPFKLAGGFMTKRNSASAGYRAKQIAELKAQRSRRENLMSQILDLKGQLDDVDQVIDNLATSISRIDRDALLSGDSDEDGA